MVVKRSLMDAISSGSSLYSLINSRVLSLSYKFIYFLLPSNFALLLCLYNLLNGKYTLDMYGF